MYRNHVRTFVAASGLAAFLISGCGTAATEPAGGAADSAAATDSGHDHEGHDHEGHDHGGHSHDHVGPHEGHVVELGGDEFHAEFVHDEEAGTVTVYVLDGAAKETVAIEATEISINLKHDGQGEQFKLAASPDAGDADGKSSRFISNDAELGDDLHHEGAEAQLVLQIAGKAYRGKIEHDHDHDHDHNHDHADDH